MDDILVSIRCITYNHAPYIRQCLDGFVMQKTNFRFEAIVHDDASTDGTADIIREYAEKYPEIIKPILETENQYSKHNGTIGRILDAAMSPTSKYVAMCEGDDYWTDPYKLQKQVDFLEGPPEYILVHSNCDILYQKTGTIVKNANKDYLNSSSLNVFEDILENRYVIRTGSVLIRKDYFSKANKNNSFIVNTSHFKMGDTPLWLELSRLGKFYYFIESMLVYRLRWGSACRPVNLAEYYRFQISIYELRLYYINKYKVSNFVLIDRIHKSYVETLYRLHCLDKRYKSPSYINISFLSHYKISFLKRLCLKMYLNIRKYLNRNV